MNFEKAFVAFARAFATVVILAVLGVVGAYWWSNVPPARSEGIPPTAVSLWAPNVGLPSPKWGAWLYCWRDSRTGTVRCRTSDKNGELKYEGFFLSSNKLAPTLDAGLKIDAAHMQPKAFDRAVFIRGALVPMVYLTSGLVLIPAEDFEAGKRLLDSDSRPKWRHPDAPGVKSMQLSLPLASGARVDTIARFQREAD
jgi:hypothetical protein